MLEKPSWVHDRDREWRVLNQFLSAEDPYLRLGLLSGRRRHGKSFLLRALAEQAGGLYLTAVREEGRTASLRRATAAVAAYAGLPEAEVAIGDWERILTTALDQTAARAAVPLLVIDELPYLLEHSPEVPGILQKLYDDSRARAGATGERGSGARIILCGSAMSVMHELLSGSQPLRGRAAMDMRLAAFGYRAARRLWSVEDPAVALRLHAVLGGAPGYRQLVATGTPDSEASFDTWVVDNLLSPDIGVFTRTETEYLLREDPRITRRTLYYDVLTAVARGASSPAKIGGLIGRERTALAHPLDVLQSSGYLVKEQDMLRGRSTSIKVVDPVIRFNQLVAVPRADLIDRGQSEQAWRASATTFRSKILGPHFEELARQWTGHYAHELLPDLEPGAIGTTVAPDPAARTAHEIDVIALDLDSRRQQPGARIRLLGEAKATVERRGPHDLARLEHIRTLLADQGYRTDGTVLALFSLSGFHSDLARIAERRADVALVDLATLYGAQG
ncbi:ATP-binding protein [Streptomyces sp. NPDC096310]|uniref:AAA family ATPase n=1 Tax=Streptomyces sp. NPDC096310 TaxID=3366082 RepID=UPI0037F11B97